MIIVPNSIKVEYLCNGVSILEENTLIIPEDGDAVDLKGVQGFVSCVTITHTQETGTVLTATVSVIKGV